MATMKSEPDTTSSPSTPAPQATTSSTPTPSASAVAAAAAAYAQWSAAANPPIDPALQQQSATQTAPTNHYPHYQFSYPGNPYQHYQLYGQPVTATTATAPAPVIARAPSQAAPPVNNSSVDATDLATLNDALGSAGVDLRAEEESLQRSNEAQYSYRPYEDRTRKQPHKPSFDTHILGQNMRQIASSHKITRIPEDSINYLALSLRARLQDLITGMIAASHHRTDTQFDRPASLYEDSSPMWSILVRSDIAKQLAALEKAEREEETRIRTERKSRIEQAAQQANLLAAAAVQGGDYEDDGGVRKKRKKEGPGVTARNMSEDVRKKMSNAVASQAAGLGGKYAWMNASNAAATSAPQRPKPTTTNSATSIATSPTPPSNTAGGWAKPYVPTKKPATSTPTTPTAELDTRTAVTLRDAMFVLEKERGHGGGRGAARGWT